MPEETAIGFQDLLVQLRIGNVLLTELLADQADRKQADLIVLMGRTGAPPAEIARLLGTTRNTVQVTLSRHRKKQRGGTQSTAVADEN